MFKRGDKIVYSGGLLFYDLTLNKSYIVKSVFCIDNVDLIQVVNDLNKLIWVRHDYFKMDICEIRKQKLQKMLK